MADEIKSPVDKWGDYEAYKKSGKPHVDFGDSDLSEFPGDSYGPLGTPSEVIELEDTGKPSDY